MSDAIAIISKPVFEKLAGKEPKLGEEYWIDRYDSTHKGLDTLADGESSLFLVTVRPGNKLWLVQCLMVLTKDARGWAAVSNHCATVDLTPVLKQLDVTKNVAPDKLAMSLQTPRALTPHDAELLLHASSEAWNHYSRKKVYAVKFPKWLLDDANAAGAAPEPAKPSKPAKATTKTASKPAPARPAKSPANGERPAKGLVDRALGQLDEVLAGEAKPAKLLAEPKRTKGLRGKMTETVQSVFAGVIDAEEQRRMLREDLAPFVDGPALALALAEAGTDLDDLVDQFAIRAIDDLARALLALALDRPADVPATCARFVDALATHVDPVKELLP